MKTHNYPHKLSPKRFHEVADAAISTALFFLFQVNADIEKKKKDRFAYRVGTPDCLLGIISLKGVELLQRSLHAQNIPIRHSSHIHNGEIMKTRQLIRIESRGASREE